MPYDDLCRLISQERTEEIVAPTGIRYQVELQAFWDDPKSQNGVLRVSAAIDDGGIRAYSPMSVDFLIRPDGSFVGEDDVA